MSNVCYLYFTGVNVPELQITPRYLVFNKSIRALILKKFSRHYFRDRLTSDIAVFAY
jgi:hypothetical protein